MSIASPGGALPADFACQVAAQVLAEIRRGLPIVPEFLDSASASVYLGMSQDWLAKARCEGNGPPYTKVSDARGGAVRYKRSDLDKFMADRREKGGAR
jgi:hypothetical protein